MNNLLYCLRRFFLISFILPGVVSLTAAAQTTSRNKTMDIVGQVYDAYLGIPLRARITLMERDSTVVDTVTAGIVDKRSHYRFRVPNVTREYILWGEMAGYEPAGVTVKARATRSGMMELADNLFLRKKGRQEIHDLGEVRVTATRLQMVCRGDTIVYDASAFALPEGSLLSDLVRQLPGAELKSNGDVYVNGQKIDYLTLNGRDFFKRNNKALLDNLPYYTVRDVKVFHRDKSELERAVDGAARDYVMDVNLKREYVRSALANAEAGLGTEGRWSGRVFGMMMGATTNVTVFGNANNVNEDRHPGQNGDWTPASQTQGVKTTKQVGLNLATQDRQHRSAENLSAHVEWDDYRLSSHSYQELFAAGNRVARLTETDSRNRALKVDVGNDYRRTDGKGNGVFWRTHATYNRNRETSLHADSTYYTSLLNRMRDEQLAHSHQLSLETRLSYMLRLRNKDLVAVTATGGYDRLRPADTFGRYACEDGAGESDNRHRYNDARRHGYNYRLQAQYAYAITADWSLRPSVGYAHKYEDRDYLSYRLDWLDGMGAGGGLGVLPSAGGALAGAFDSRNSNRYANHRDTYAAAVDLIWSRRNRFLVLTVPLEAIRDDARFEHDGDRLSSRRSYGLVQPSLRYSRSGKNRMNIDYSMRVAMPDLYQLMPFADAGTPTSVYVNNPALRRRVENNLSAYWSFRIDSLRVSYWLGAEGSYVRHAWGVRTRFDNATGVFTYMTDNVSKPNWTGTAKAGVTWDVDTRRRFTLTADGLAGYVRSVDFMVTDAADDDALSIVNTMRAVLNASLRYKLGGFRAGLGGKVMGRYSRSSREGFESIRTCDFQYGVNAQYRVPWVGVTVATDVNMYSRRGYSSAEMNDNSLVWNMSVTKSLAKGAITAKIVAFDLLHELSNRQYSVNAQGYTETWYNSVPRYVMGTLAFAINTKKGSR